MTYRSAHGQYGVRNEWSAVAMAEQTLAAQSPSPAADVPRVEAGVLAAFVQRALAAAGLPAPDAAQVAELMVEADLRGSDTHGVIRLPLYVRRLKSGGINKQPNIRLIQDKPSAALVDGDNGMGHLVMRFAAHTAIAKAKRTGVGWVGARMSNHAGPAALYAMMPLSHDMIGIYLAVGSNNHLPPWGARENLLGTNPIAIAIPAWKNLWSCSTWRRPSLPSERCGSRRSAVRRCRLAG